MDFTLRSNLISYLIGIKHYIIPQWIQILLGYADINSHFDLKYVEEEKLRVKAHGYGLQPELYLIPSRYLREEGFHHDDCTTH